MTKKMTAGPQRDDRPRIPVRRRKKAEQNLKTFLERKVPDKDSSVEQESNGTPGEGVFIRTVQRTVSNVSSITGFSGSFAPVKPLPSPSMDRVSRFGNNCVPSDIYGFTKNNNRQHRDLLQKPQRKHSGPKNVSLSNFLASDTTEPQCVSSSKGSKGKRESFSGISDLSQSIQSNSHCSSKSSSLHSSLQKISFRGGGLAEAGKSVSFSGIEESSQPYKANVFDDVAELDDRRRHLLMSMKGDDSTRSDSTDALPTKDKFAAAASLNNRGLSIPQRKLSCDDSLEQSFRHVAKKKAEESPTESTTDDPTLTRRAKTRAKMLNSKMASAKLRNTRERFNAALLVKGRHSSLNKPQRIPSGESDAMFAGNFRNLSNKRMDTSLLGAIS